MSQIPFVLMGSFMKWGEEFAVFIRSRELMSVKARGWRVSSLSPPRSGGRNGRVGSPSVWGPWNRDSHQRRENVRSRISHWVLISGYPRCKKTHGLWD